MATQAGVAGTKVAGAAGFRLIPRIETYPEVISFAQTVLGKLVILTVFGLEVSYFTRDFLSMFGFTFVFAAAAFMPEHRRFILALAPIAFVVVLGASHPLRLSATLAVIITGVLLYLCVMRWPGSIVAERPITFILSGLTILILFACSATPHSLAHQILWDLVAAGASYVWFICYAATDRNSNPRKDLTLELTAFRPLWSSTFVPFPKGAAYLRRIEAKNPEQLAVVQLKGIKLGLWAILLALLQKYWIVFFHQYLRIPTAPEALAMSVLRTPVAWHLRWEAQVLTFLEIVMTYAIFGHRIVAACRIAGFNALRNSYRPLSSTTIAEFFNRFYYYFKELLVDFFFYPTFLRYWKKHRKTRMVFATIAAAFFGNSIFHLIRDWSIIRDYGLRPFFVGYQALFFQNAMLTVGLCISQLRKRGPKRTGYLRGQLIPSLGVGFFYCLLSVFAIAPRMYSLSEHLRYFASLFFIRY